jgi:two-component system, chemotaxis family, protein-glutamate methylesterase/glutaminase
VTVTEAGRRLRVLVVDDSPVQRQVLSALLAADPQLEIAGWAANGADAIRAVERLRPDVVTLDESMPAMGGIEAAQRIMHDHPTPIVMVTSTSRRDFARAAIEAGALAVQDKRALDASNPRAASELVRVVKSMAQIRLVRRRTLSDSPGGGFATTPPLPSSARPEVIAIGASTGGPQSLRDIVSRLPSDFAVPILVVQHTASGFLGNLVDWIRLQTTLPVQLAEAGQLLGRPGVYIAPTDQHLMVNGRTIVLGDEPPCSLHRPSATVLFRSVAKAFGAMAIGVQLTGMGNDGAAGMRDLKRAGATTIAQDESSSAVFGMPAEAIRLGVVDHVLPPDRIAGLLKQLAGAEEGGSSR